MCELLSAIGVAVRLLPGTNRLIVEYVAEALLDLTDSRWGDGGASELDNRLVIREIRKFNAALEFRERIVGLLDQTEFKCRWALPCFDYNPQLPSFALDEPFKSAPLDGPRSRTDLQ